MAAKIAAVALTLTCLLAAVVLPTAQATYGIYNAYGVYGTYGTYGFYGSYGQHGPYAYGYYYGTHSGLYGKPIFLTKPQLILPPPAAPAAPEAGVLQPAVMTPAVAPVETSPPSCSVYIRATSTGQDSGSLTLVVSATSNANFEAPYTLTFAVPTMIALTEYNTNNSPSSVTLGEGGVVTSVVNSVIPAFTSNTLTFGLTSSAPDAAFNPGSTFAPVWVSVNGIACGIVSGF